MLVRIRKIHRKHRSLKAEKGISGIIRIILTINCQAFHLPLSEPRTYIAIVLYTAGQHKKQCQRTDYLRINRFHFPNTLKSPL